MRLEISNQCFKVDKPNYIAMTAGIYLKDENIITNVGFPSENKVRQAIWCNINNFGYPKLIVCQKEVNERQPLNRRFTWLDNGLPTLPYSHIAFLDHEYFIGENWDNRKMWSEICTNGLFNIWKPIAPRNRFDVDVHFSFYRIQLLRVYKIEENFNVDKILLGSYSNAHIKNVDTKISVNIIEPVIPDDKFLKIKNLLELTLNKFGLNV